MPGTRYDEIPGATSDPYSNRASLAALIPAFISGMNAAKIAKRESKEKVVPYMVQQKMISPAATGEKGDFESSGFNWNVNPNSNIDMGTYKDYTQAKKNEAETDLIGNPSFAQLMQKRMSSEDVQFEMTQIQTNPDTTLPQKKEQMASLVDQNIDFVTRMTDFNNRHKTQALKEAKFNVQANEIRKKGGKIDFSIGNLKKASTPVNPARRKQAESWLRANGHDVSPENVAEIMRQMEAKNK